MTVLRKIHIISEKVAGNRKIIWVIYRYGHVQCAVIINLSHIYKNSCIAIIFCQVHRDSKRIGTKTLSIFRGNFVRSLSKNTYNCSQLTRLSHNTIFSSNFLIIIIIIFYSVYRFAEHNITCFRFMYRYVRRCYAMYHLGFSEINKSRKKGEGRTNEWGKDIYIYLYI